MCSASQVPLWKVENSVSVARLSTLTNLEGRSAVRQCVSSNLAVLRHFHSHTQLREGLGRCEPTPASTSSFDTNDGPSCNNIPIMAKDRGSVKGQEFRSNPAIKPLKA